MNYHCWRDTGTKVNDDDEKKWPKLPHATAEERSHSRTIMRSRISQLRDELLSGGSEEIDLHENLNDIEYPKLGEIVLKRKHSFMEGHDLKIHDIPSNSEMRRSRRLRSTDLIHVNLQKTLERHKWPILLQANQPTKITVDICKLNVNMSVGTSLDPKWLLTKSKRGVMHIGKKKKPSRLKWLILYERMIRKQLNAGKRQIGKMPSSQASNEAISGINFDNLQINVRPPDDPDFLRKMSALSCLNTNYREPSQIDITEDTLIFRPDLHEQMENMSLDNRDESEFQNSGNNNANDCDGEFIDGETMNATLSLKICDETGEFTENISIKEEPGRINFTKKFREYCTNMVTIDLKTYLDDFLAEISRLQKKMYERDSIKGKCKRRYYAGIKEVQKHIELKKIKLVVIASDLEKVETEGGLDDVLSKLMGTCKRYEVPYCFGLGRRKLGYYTHGKGFVSCIGIANYSGAEEKLKNVVFEVVEARNEFSRLMSGETKTIDVEKFLPKEELLLSKIINAYLKILASTS